MYAQDPRQGILPRHLLVQNRGRVHKEMLVFVRLWYCVEVLLEVHS